MKTVKMYSSLALFFAFGLFLSGCYTELATEELAYDDQPYVESDTTVDEGNVIVNNNYYLDDDYRRSRMRVSFNYYYPTYHSSWIAGYYHSYYDDYYWGWNPYHYPGCTIWWPPVYDHWYPYPYPYYPIYVYYPIYYPSPIAGGGGTVIPSRPRDNGPSRDPRVPGERTRPLPSPTTGTTVAVGNGGVRTRPMVEEGIRRPTVEGPRPPRVDKTAPEGGTIRQPENNQPRPVRNDVAAPETEKPRQEKPWWERNKEEVRKTDNADRPRNAVITRQPEQRRTVNESAPPSERRKPAVRTEEKNKKVQPEYSVPPRQTVPKSGNTRTSQQPREERRSYSPPPAQSRPSAPASSPRTGGSGSSGGNSGGSRKRGE